MSARTRVAPLLVLVAVTVAAACGSSDEPDVSVTLTSPVAGEAVAGGVSLDMAAEGITIEPAGEARDDAGHFHVVADDGCIDEGEVIPKDADHVHFGGGQSTGVVYLESGRHELCLQVGDGTHMALPPTDRVTIEVGIDSRDEWCAVVGEVDDLFTAVDNGDDDFATKQVGYEGIRRLLSQLSSAIDQVDDDARADVHASLAFAANVTTAFTTAADFHEAEEALEPLFADMRGGLPGAAWVLDACDVDIDG
jgi:hypothetical protein